MKTLSSDLRNTEPTTEYSQLSFITPREREVLDLLTKGLSSKQIAYELHISISTVNNHRQNMLKKTQTQSTAQLVFLYLKS